MGVKLRLHRAGCKNNPFYRLVAADSKSPRDGKHLEVLGYYSPLPGQDGFKRMGLKFDRVKYFLSVGAQPSDPVQRLLVKAGVLPPPPMWSIERKSGRDIGPVHLMTGRIPAPEVSRNVRTKMAFSDDEVNGDEDETLSDSTFRLNIASL